MSHTTLSKKRKRILERMAKLEASMSQFLEVREPMVHGWVRRNRRKCGHPNCRCARGELHETLTFGTREGGREFHRGIPTEKVAALQACTKRWRRYRRGRAALVKEFDRLLNEIDSLEKLLCQPWQEWITPETEETKE
ncbi:MAG: DUF6788 family protein [Candidatus Binatia bacterium]